MAGKQKVTDKEQQLWNRFRSAKQRQGAPSSVPAKKKSKPVSYKMQNTFERNLRGVPGAGRFPEGSIIKMIAAETTGTVIRKEPIGLLRSGRNANTTQGSYITTIVTSESRVESDSQGRKAFGR